MVKGSANVEPHLVEMKDEVEFANVLKGPVQRFNENLIIYRYSKCFSVDIGSTSLD